MPCLGHVDMYEICFDSIIPEMFHPRSTEIITTYVWCALILKVAFSVKKIVGITEK